MTACPCASGLAFDQCCGPVIAGRPAETPLALMRARYSAFIQGEIAFLAATLAPEKRAAMDEAEVARSAKDAEAAGFEVIAADGEGDEAGLEYVARFIIRGRPHAHHERARFRREADRWLYVDGQVNPKSAPMRADKVGRNDPCPCGSGKKFKKCCG